MRRAVRAIIIRDDKLLVMHRNKFGEEYYTLLGGGVDFGEAPEQSLFREVREESGLQVGHCRLVFIEEAGNPYGTQYIYLCDDPGGEPVLDPQSAEASINELGQNIHTPMWLSIEELKRSPFLSETLKHAILNGIQNGFPESPVTLRPSAFPEHSAKE